MEILLGALAEAIIGIVIGDLASRNKLAGVNIAGLRERLRGESPEMLALKLAFIEAYLACKRANPQFDIALLEGYLRDQAVQRELAKLLLTEDEPDRANLKNTWDSRYFLTHDRFNIDDFLDCFLPEAAHHIKNQPALKPFTDSQALGQLYAIAERSAEQVELQTQIRDLLQRITELLAHAAAFTAPPIVTYTVTGIFATQPAAIPEQPEKLIGREALQAEVEDSLNGGKRVLLLQGFGGMGKTALAATIAAKWVAEKGPVLWIKAGQAAADALLEGLARPFGAEKPMAAAQGEAKIDVLRQILIQSGATLLVIDDAWEGNALAPVLKAVPNSLPLLLTSRIRHAVGEIKPVGELDPAAALELLEQHAQSPLVPPASRGKIPADEPAMLLCDTLGYHAFAIEIAGKNMLSNQWTPAELLRKIEHAPHNLNVPEDLAPEGRRRVADLIEVSLEALKAKDENAYHVFLAFGAFFAPAATPELLHLYLQAVGARLASPAERQDVDSALTTLTRRGLAELVPKSDISTTHYRLHDLAYSYARAQNSDDQRNRAVDACLRYIGKYNIPNLKNFSVLRPEMENFIGAGIFAFSSGSYEIGKLFVLDLTSSNSKLHQLGWYTQSALLLNHAIIAAQRTKNLADTASYQGNLSKLCEMLGQYELAIKHGQEALKIALEIDYKIGAERILGNLGLIHEHCKQYEQAIDFGYQALVIADEIDDQPGKGRVLGILGSAFAGIKQCTQAISYGQQAVSLAAKIGNNNLEAHLRGELGVIYYRCGQYEQAIDCCHSALEISRVTGDQYSEGVCLGNLGVIHTKLGRHERAIGYYQQARATFEAIGVPHLVAQADRNITRTQAALAGDGGAGGDAAE